MTTLGDNLRQAYGAPAMSDGEKLTRAREAWIAVNRPWRWLARRVRAGKCDKRLRVTLAALDDLARPMSLIVADRDEATVALLMRASPGLDALDYDTRCAVAAAIATGVRMGRRG